ncbi:MAG: hypothetical protein KGH99_07205 [Thaumarchaeota archaeon]|nr:hypothetical protein [Candidatus Nitrosotalea sp.]MDE1873247.1 hypothetical protein [Nitrososphaerota archaeon]
MSNVHLVLYKITGNQLFFNVPSSVCEECDLTANTVKKILNEINDPRIEFEIKPWMNNLFSALRKGGWHPPVLLINGKIFSQGIVPEVQKLKENMIKELQK